MTLGEFEPDLWIPASHPAAGRGTISLAEMASLQVIYGPRRVSPGTYDRWLDVLRIVDPHFADDDVWYQAMIASPRSNAQVVETARQGVGILGPGTPAAARLENIARFLDFVGENITRAAEQAREVLYTKAEATSPSSSPTPRPLSATEPSHNGRTPPPPPTGLA